MYTELEVVADAGHGEAEPFGRWRGHGRSGRSRLVRPCGLTSRLSSERVRVAAMLSGWVAPSQIISFSDRRGR
jgi:hypothetical protein